MDAYYGYETALWYWRLNSSGLRAPRHVTRLPEVGSYVSSDVQELAQRPNWLDPELLALIEGRPHAMVFHAARRVTRGVPVWSLCSDVPRDSFSPAGEHSYVASPEFCFLQMAQKLGFADLVLLGMELCGFYSLDPYAEEGLRQREVALTNRDRIGAFLDENEGARGRRKAQTALQYVVDGAASPMESALVMLLCLPYRRGGYSLPRPKLNYLIELDEKARTLTNNSYCLGDICWPDAHLDLEYLGVSAHEGRSRMLADRGRTLAISEMGYEVIEVTEEQVLDLEALDVIASRIASKLGKRIRAEENEAASKRLALRCIVFSWKDYAGPQEETFDGADEDEGVVFGRRA